jgi:hypothetical protein
LLLFHLIKQQFRYQTAVPSDLPAAIIPQLKSFISAVDVALLAQTLTVVSLLLQQTPATTFPEVERDLLREIYDLGHSPRVSGTALDALLTFIGALVEADNQIATHLVPSFVIAAEKALKEESSLLHVARCIAQVVKSQQAVAAGTIAEFTKHIKVMKMDITCILFPNGVTVSEGEDFPNRAQSSCSWGTWSFHVSSALTIPPPALILCLAICQIKQIFSLKRPTSSHPKTKKFGRPQRLPQVCYFSTSVPITG